MVAVTGLIIVGSLGALVLLAILRDWLYNGRGRWKGVPPPDNVTYLEDYRDV